MRSIIMIRLSLFIKLVIEKRFINEALEKGYGVSAVSKAFARLKQEIPMIGNYRNLLGSLIQKSRSDTMHSRNQFLNLSGEYIN
jgi:hypothetical protein